MWYAYSIYRKPWEISVEILFKIRRLFWGALSDFTDFYNGWDALNSLLLSSRTALNKQCKNGRSLLHIFLLRGWMPLEFQMNIWCERFFYWCKAFSRPSKQFFLIYRYLCLCEGIAMTSNVRAEIQYVPKSSHHIENCSINT